MNATSPAQSVCWVCGDRRALDGWRSDVRPFILSEADESAIRNEECVAMEEVPRFPRFLLDGM